MPFSFNSSNKEDALPLQPIQSLLSADQFIQRFNYFSYMVARQNDTERKHKLSSSLQDSCSWKLLLSLVLLFIYMVLILQYVFDSFCCVLVQYLYFKAPFQWIKPKHKSCLQYRPYGLHSANEIDFPSDSMKQLFIQRS